MRDQDQQFYDSFMLVIGLLIGVAVGLFFLARWIAVDTQHEVVMSDPRVIAQIDERLAPIGRVVLLGEEELEAAAQVAAAPAADAVPLTGEQVYSQYCRACHMPPGLAGAPALGDAQAWAGRVEKGVEALEQNAIDGYMGSTGYMPPKGGFPALSDQEVIDAVHYMVDQL